MIHFNDGTRGARECCWSAFSFLFHSFFTCFNVYYQQRRRHGDSRLKRKKRKKVKWDNSRELNDLSQMRIARKNRDHSIWYCFACLTLFIIFIFIEKKSFQREIFLLVVSSSSKINEWKYIHHEIVSHAFMKLSSIW